jgi:hypothetical protein
VAAAERRRRRRRGGGGGGGEGSNVWKAVGSHRAQIRFVLLWKRAVWLRSLVVSCDSGGGAHNRTELQYYIIKRSGFPSPFYPFRPKRHTMALRN